MPEKMHRTQILLRPEQHAELARIAETEGRSVSDVVREMVDLALESRSGGAEALEGRNGDVEAVRQRREKAWEDIQRFRDEILERRGGQPLDVDFVDLINQARDERDAEILGTLLGTRD